MIERLVAPGSIPKLAMRRCVLGKDKINFQEEQNNPPVVVTQVDERRTNRSQKWGSALLDQSCRSGRAFQVGFGPKLTKFCASFRPKTKI